jgi:hypothetical protein
MQITSNSACRRRRLGKPQGGGRPKKDRWDGHLLFAPSVRLHPPI